MEPPRISYSGRPMSACASVDLPEPFGPMRAWTSPEATWRSPTAVLDLLDHGAAERTRERRDGQAVEHVVEEPEHDQSLRLRRRHAAALEVVELVLVDGTDGAGVRAPHVVGLDLEVRDRL